MTYLAAFTLSLSLITVAYLLSARRAKVRRFRLHKRMEETLFLNKEALPLITPPSALRQRMHTLQSHLIAPFKRNAEPAQAQLVAPHLLILSFLLGVLVSLVTSALTVSLLVFIAIKTCGR